MPLNRPSFRHANQDLRDRVCFLRGPDHPGGPIAWPVIEKIIGFSSRQMRKWVQLKLKVGVSAPS